MFRLARYLYISVIAPQTRLILHFKHRPVAFFLLAVSPDERRRPYGCPQGQRHAFVYLVDPLVSLNGILGLTLPAEDQTTTAHIIKKPSFKPSRSQWTMMYRLSYWLRRYATSNRYATHGLCQFQSATSNYFWEYVLNARGLLAQGFLTGLRRWYRFFRPLAFYGG